MYQAVNTTQVDEYTIRSDILHSAFQYLAFFKFRHDLSFLLFKFSFNQCFMGNNYVFVFVVDLYHLEFHGLVNINIVITDRFHIDL